MASLNDHVLSRRMQPGDIRRCLETSDIYPVVKARGITDELESALQTLMERDRFWGSMVLSASNRELLCHGSCIFLRPKLGEEVLAGKHPFLLADIASSTHLFNQVLEFDQVESESEKGNLYFYGALFTFPSFRNPPLAGKALVRLHADCVLQMRGMHIKWHMKPTYGVHHVYDEVRFRFLGAVRERIVEKVTNVMLRKKFGTDLYCDYGDLKSNDPEVRRFRPALFAVDQETSSTRRETLVHQIIGDATPREMNLTPKMRNILRLEIEHNRDSSIVKSLNGKEGYIREALERLKSKLDLPKEVSEELEANLEINEELRQVLARLVSQNLHELGVLPQMTAAEKELWKKRQNEVRPK